MGSRPPFNPLPICPNPIQWDIPKRITDLEAVRDKPETPNEQKINIQVAIDVYKEKKCAVPRFYIQDGKIIDLQSLNPRRIHWADPGDENTPIPEFEVEVGDTLDNYPLHQRRPCPML
ncbi:hypothetical protein MGYG_00387 [Nannizzia gypsea CBS 118893]|uniref:Uncharacterized protein n=1 Tax=Arthroderma gypseum (strain ATCC MYA-4604 / CBS 118893) TaxID=535722 RepID=E5QZI2_ARTGP|nr:hypothetical protein MGYG_00387 [Nannizzia gypsea CBS 118893]EFQ97348.1 hypothetical protein MGYG_00387 [Nannizzia gypsea CBS 118893]